MAIPSYVVKQCALLVRGMLHPVEQVGVAHPRIVGYFPTRADADAYVAMANYMEELASDANGNRTV